MLQTAVLQQVVQQEKKKIQTICMYVKRKKKSTNLEKMCL